MLNNKDKLHLIYNLYNFVIDNCIYYKLYINYFIIYTKIKIDLSKNSYIISRCPTFHKKVIYKKKQLLNSYLY